METTLLTLLHLLVFAYWLGGDIGVFYASTLLTDSQREQAGRLAAGKIVADVDLIPRFCLLLTLPTGLALASAKGWMSLSPLLTGAAFVAAFLWILLVIRLHLNHGGGAMLKRFDMVLRILFLLGLAATGAGAIAGLWALPLFIAVKLLLLGFAVLMGLVIRQLLEPFGPAYLKLATHGADPQTDSIIAGALAKARPAVMMIWISLIGAAFLGVATPV